jgi:hypothetical protein
MSAATMQFLSVERYLTIYKLQVAGLESLDRKFKRLQTRDREILELWNNWKWAY